MQFSEKPDSVRINHNFQKIPDLGHKNIVAGSIITMSMIQHHFCLLIMNRKFIKFSNMSKLALLLRTICKTGIQAKTIC